MSRSTKILTLAALLLSKTLLSQSDKVSDLTGIWRFTFENGMLGDKLLGLKAAKKDFEVVDLNTSEVLAKQPAPTLNASAQFSFDIPAKYSAAGKITMKARFEGGSISGEAKGMNVDTLFKAIKLPTLFLCAHSPAHAATSEEEMQDLTKKEQCRGWHQVRNLEPTRVEYRGR